MNFKLQPVLENETVKLRPLIPSDFESLFAIASDPFIWEQHQNKNRYTPENFTEFFNEAMASKGALAILDNTTKKIIGSSRFKCLEDAKGVVEVGWSFLSRAYWGGRYNRAVKKLMVQHALQFNDYVVFYVDPKNHRSQRAMEKLGARKMVFPEKAWVLNEDIGITYVISSPIED